MSKQAEEYYKNEYPNLQNGTIQWIFEFAEAYHQSKIEAIIEDMQNEVKKIVGNKEFNKFFWQGYYECHIDYKTTVELLNK